VFNASLRVDYDVVFLKYCNNIKKFSKKLTDIIEHTFFCV